MSERPAVWEGTSWTAGFSTNHFVSLKDPGTKEPRRSLVIDLPEGCPEHYPKHGQEVRLKISGTSLGLAWGVPYLSTFHDKWCIRSDHNSSYYLDALTWDGKPEPTKRYVVEIEATSEDEAHTKLRTSDVSLREITKERKDV